MDKLSELIQEAKPLYIKRKKRMKFVKNLLCIISPVIFCTLLVLPLTLNKDNSSDFHCTQNTSIIEQMGFPTDDYGLLKVD